MNKLKNILRMLLIGIIISNISYSANPTYSLKAKNFNYTSSNVLEFDIYLKNTSSNPTLNFLEYAMGQYMFNVDPAFVNGGVLTYALAVQPVIAGQIPAIYRPSLPVVHQNQLRIKNTNGTNPGAGPIISSTGDGTFVVRMKLTNTVDFVRCGPSLTWRNASSGGLYTKLIAYTYNAGGPGQNITNPANHIIESTSDVVNVFPGGNGYPNLSSAIAAIKNGVHGTGAINVGINCDVLETGAVNINDGSFIPSSITIYPTADHITLSKTALPFDNINIYTTNTDITIDGRKNKTGNLRALTIIGNLNNDIGKYGCIKFAGTKNCTVQYVNFEFSSNYGFEQIAFGNTPNAVTNINNNVFKIIPKEYGGAFFPRAISIFYPKGTLNITNNFIYNTDIPTPPINTNLFGIYVTRENHVGDNSGIVNMIHNTVHLQGGNLNGYSTCASLEYNGNTYFERNNIFINDMTSGDCFAKSANVITASPNFDADYNCYYTTNPGITSGVVNLTSINYVSLPKYQCAVSPFEQNTNFKAALFSAGTPNLSGSSINDYDLMGTYVASVAADINNTLRNTSHPYMGAYEAAAFTFNPTLRIRVYLDGAPPPKQEPVTIELRDNNGTTYPLLTGSSPFNVTLSTSGTVSLNCTGVTFPPTFYIVVKHRNSLQTWSKDGGETMPVSNYMNYDFSSSPTQAYCSDAVNCNLVQDGCRYFIPSGDVNQDGYIDWADQTLVGLDGKSPGNGTLPCPENNFVFNGPGISTQTLPLSTDLNNDGVVDCYDVCIVDQNTANGFTHNSPLNNIYGCETIGLTQKICSP